MSVAIFRNHIGYSREATYGTTGTLGTRYIPVLAFNPGWKEEIEYIVDKGIRGAPAMDFAMYQGTVKTRLGYESYFYPDNCGIFLRGIFGGETVSTGAAPFTHTFGSTDTPPSYTLYDFYGLGSGSSERRIVGAQLESVEIAFTRANGALTVRPTWVGWGSTGVVESVDTYTTQAPFRGWEAVIDYAGTTNTRILEFTSRLVRPVELIYGGSNTQNPNAREPGPLEHTGTLSVYASNSTEFDRFLANSTGALGVVLSDSTNSLTWTITDFKIEDVTLDRGGAYARWDVSWRGLYSATDTGPGRIALVVQSSCEF